MTRSLFVMRHGKSDWSAPEGGDHERPLKRRGRRAAEQMGRLLTAADCAPDLVLSSSAVRAHTTAEIACEAGQWDCPLEVSRELYEASPAGVLEHLRALGAELQRILVVGHEPTCSELVGALSGSPPPSFPTATLARVDFELASWDLVVADSGRLAWLIPPRALGI